LGGTRLGLIDALKKLMGMQPVDIGELNRQAIAPPSRLQTTPISPPSQIEITDEFRAVAGLLDRQHPIVFVSGKAGTGKTTLIHWLRETRRNVVVVAPTGVAALNAKGSTIHSFFRLPPRLVNEEDLDQPRERRLYSSIGLLIVDEISMVRADVVDAIDGVLRRNGPDRNKLFGGIQVLLVGDLFQLPPVANPEEEKILNRKYDSLFFFSAQALQKCALVPVELTKAYRQRDVAFAELLNRIRVAEDLENTLKTINAECSGRPESDSLITLSCTNDVADRLNSAELRNLPEEEKTFIGTATGDSRVKDDKLPSPKNLALKIGAKVMFTKNDSGRWVNGTLGRVVSLGESSIGVELLTDDPGKVHEVSRATWEYFKYEYDPVEDRIKPVVTWRYVQFPLMLAWAVTIHKSQGKTLSKVRIDLGAGAFASGQVYVALSRCRALTDIRLARPIRSQEVRCDERIKRFYLALAGLQRPEDGKP
jgi:ATP-dependent DNA helicase PIF1